MKNTSVVGKLGEDLTVEYLKRRGYRILDRNFKVEFGGRIRGEIDIICRLSGINFLFQPSQTVFVEVKIMKNESDFLAEDKIDFRKQRRMIRTAEIWLVNNKIPLDSAWRFDLVIVKTNQEDGNPLIEHLENIFGL